MAKFKLAFGIHNHQPIGNFEHVFEEAHRNAYSPFLKLLAKYNRLSISLHQSGILWNWQETHHSEYLDLVRQLIDDGRIELMTGGFYEPILTSIPERDVHGQITMLNDYLRDRFNAVPVGLWLTERIWEPHLPRLIAQANAKYVPIDDTHFLYAGFERNQLYGPLLTETEGYATTLLPISKRLRYLIPFGTVEEVISELQRCADRNPAGMAVYADDGEKFGVWPETHKHCYLDRWLERFFEAMEKNSDWLEVIPLEQAAAVKPIGRAYIPSASYEEMLHWSLPPAAFREYEQFENWLRENRQWEKYGRFVRGGHWRNFLAKYEESNLMHKKMIRVSNRLAEFERESPEKIAQAREVRESLYASQCNCPYWHGVFGGLYLPHIRQAVLASMIDADYKLRQLRGEKGYHTAAVDFDADGNEELIVSGDRLTAVFRPGTGGMMLDLSLNRHGFSLTDTLSRRREGYHDKLNQAAVPTKGSNSRTASIHDRVQTKQEGLADCLFEDRYLKRCFIDHFLADGVTLDDFVLGKYKEQGDFIREPFEYSLNNDSHSLEMTRQGRLQRRDGQTPVSLAKRFDFDPNGLQISVTYTIVNLSDSEIDVNFAVENNFTFQAGHTDDRYLLIDGHRPQKSFLDSIDEHRLAHGVAMVDDYRSLAVALRSEPQADVWHLPIFTVSRSEGGFEKVYQGTTLLHRYRLHLSQTPAVMRLSLIAGAKDSVLEKAFTAQVVGG